MKTEIMEVCNQEMKKKEGKNKGFSLVELIVVIAIMAILAIVIAPQVMKYIGKSKDSVDDANISLYKTAVTTALADEAVYSEVAATDADTVTITVTAVTGGSPTVTYGNTKATSEFVKELDSILESTYPVPAKAGHTKFTITINIDKTKKEVGTISVTPS